MEKKLLTSYIDHTLLSPLANKDDIRRLCEEAVEYKFAAVCVPPYHVQQAQRFLKESQVKVTTVIGFPMGYAATSTKAEEIKRAFNDGAEELDVVVNIAAVKSGDWNYIENDIDTMSRMVGMKGKLIKVILEVELLTEEEIKRLCQICVEKEVHFIKTSTGFNGKGNQPEMIRFLRDILPDHVQIKASGGIRSQVEALSLIEAGADRLGCSKSIEIVND